jgi:hypothetical protein
MTLTWDRPPVRAGLAGILGWAGDADNDCAIPSSGPGWAVRPGRLRAAKKAPRRRIYSQGDDAGSQRSCERDAWRSRTLWDDKGPGRRAFNPWFDAQDLDSGVNRYAELVPLAWSRATRSTSRPIFWPVTLKPRFMARVKAAGSMPDRTGFGRSNRDTGERT